MADVTGRERANAVLAKYADRIRGNGVAGLVPEWWTELRDDIENAIDGALSMVPMVDDPVEEPAKRRNATHMPATGTHGKR